MSSSGQDKTEAPTPKRRQESREKGQVARSADLNGAFVLFGALLALGVFGPGVARRMEKVLHDTLTLAETPEVVGQAGIGPLLGSAGTSVAIAVGPIAVLCLVAGLAASVGQVGFKPSAKALKPDAKRLNPLQGAKQIFGVNAIFETGKNLMKVSVVGAIVALAVIPELPELAALVGMEPRALAGELSRSVFDVAKRAAVAYLLIGIVDFVWQRHRTEKGMRMTKEEVRREHKEQQVSPEMRMAQKRRQMAANKARMMAAVPTADVVVTNPTHFSVALRYDGSHPAPLVVAKGQDLIALEIRRIAGEHGVPIVPDAPLARSLHSSVEIGQEIPEALYQAVAQLLAFVYRTAGRRAAA